MIKIYVARQNSDLTEGRGGLYPKGYFTTETDAVMFLSTLDGIMGTRQGLDIVEVDVYESIEEHPKWTKEMLIKSALLKLTDKEKEALGFA